MKCWSCKQNTMKMRDDGRFYQCDCGATESIGGAADTETRPEDQKGSVWAGKNR